MSELKEVEAAFVQASKLIGQLENEIVASIDLTPHTDDYNLTDWCTRVSETVSGKMKKMMQLQLVIGSLIEILTKEGHPCIWDEGDSVICIDSSLDERLTEGRTYVVEHVLEVADEAVLVKLKGFSYPLPVSAFVLVTNPGFDID